jgi:hypothetical protein
MRRQRQHVWRVLAMQVGQEVGRGLIARQNWTRRVALDHAFLAEILGDQKTLVEIGVVDFGRREAAVAQRAGDRNEGPDVLG